MKESKHHWHGSQGTGTSAHRMQSKLKVQPSMKRTTTEFFKQQVEKYSATVEGNYSEGF